MIQHRYVLVLRGGLIPFYKIGVYEQYLNFWKIVSIFDERKCFI